MPNLHLQKSPTATASKEPMEWLTRKLDFRRTLRPWMPDGYERYARVLHPAFTMDLEDEKGVGEISVPWSTVSAWSGKSLTATSHIRDLMLRADGIICCSPGSGSAIDLVAAKFCIEERDSGNVFGMSDG